MKRIIAAILLSIGLAPTALWAAVTCPASVTGISPSATSCWPLQEQSGTAITDTIGSNSGTIGGSYKLNQNGGISCDNTTTGTNGENGCNITTPSDLSNPQPMTLYFDFAGTSGGIAQLGTSSGTAGVPYYVIFLDNHGKLTFGVDNFDTQEIIQSPLPYADGNEHKAVVSVGAGGEKLYVDGSLVASRNVTLANYVNGYWFFGGINTANWQLSPSYENFNGTLYTFAWWNGSQLTDAQAISLTGGNPTAITNTYCVFSNQIASLNPATGQAYANQNLTFTINSIQVPGGGSVLPIGPSKEVCQTDSSGNILAGCQVPQGAHVNLSVGFGPPIPIVIPFSTSCDLTAILLSQTDPPEVVSGVATAGPLFSGTTVTNPPAGTIGTSTITAPAAFSQTQSSAATVNIGTNGNVQQVIMTGNVAVSLTNFASGASFLIDTTENGTGGYSPTFSVPSGWWLEWPGAGSQPGMPSTAANAHNVWQFMAVSSSVLVGNVSTVSTGTFPLSGTANFNYYSGTNINTLTTVQLAAPSGVGVSATCSGTCATTYTYEVTCLGDNSTETVPSSTATSINAATLDGTHYNVITWSAETGCHDGYNVYGRISGSLGLIGTTTALTFTDNSASTPGAVPPTVNSTGKTTTGGNATIAGTLGVTGAATLTGGVSGNLAVTGTVASGTNGGTGGKLTMNGATSGSAAIGVAAAAGTPAEMVLPTTSGSAGQLLSTDGSGNLSWVSTAHLQWITTTGSGTFTIPDTITAVCADIYGAGGGGGGGLGNGGTTGGGGGGGGAHIKTCFTGLTPGGTLSYTVGAGGTAGTGGSSAGGATTDGGNGGNTTFNSVTANGGSGGKGGTNSGTGGTGGAALSSPVSSAVLENESGSDGISFITSTPGPGATNFANGGAGGATGGTGVAGSNGTAGANGYILVTW